MSMNGKEISQEVKKFEGFFKAVFESNYLDKLGIEPKTKSLNEILEIIKPKFNGLDRIDATHLSNKIVGSRFANLLLVSIQYQEVQ